jgi:hypothetical protein
MKANQRFGGKCCLHLQGKISQARKQREGDGKQSSETSVNFKWITRCYILKEITLHKHRCDALKSYKLET